MGPPGDQGDLNACLRHSATHKAANRARTKNTNFHTASVTESRTDFISKTNNPGSLTKFANIVDCVKFADVIYLAK